MVTRTISLFTAIMFLLTLLLAPLNPGVCVVGANLPGKGQDLENNGLTAELLGKEENSPRGIWIYTKYGDVEKYTEIKTSTLQFLYMILHPYYGIPQSIDVDDDGIRDIECNIRLYLTSISSKIGIKSSFQVNIERKLEEELTVMLTCHLPILFSSDYISLSSGFLYTNGEPTEIETGFGFSFALFSPGGRTFQIDLIPEYGYKKNISAIFSYAKCSSSGHHITTRTFYVDFSPATELHITTIPRDLKVHYSFGNSAGTKTKITFRSYRDGNPNKMHSFIIDPLPSYMSFDLSVFGGRNFIYESDRSFDVTYIMEASENNTPIKLELVHIPTRIEADWGITGGLLPPSLGGFVDLDMSDNIKEVNLYFNNSEKPFMSIKNFPRKLRVEGYIDLFLHGKITASKFSGSPTEITTTIRFKKWEVQGSLTVKDGTMKLEWGLPFGSNRHALIKFDTDNHDMLGADIKVIDVENNTKFLILGFDRIATDNFGVSWDSQSGGSISNFRWHGRITKLSNLRIYVYHEGKYFNITGSWTLRKEGHLLVELNKDVNVTFANVSSENFKLYGYISLYGNRKLKLDWEWGDTGHFTIYTFNRAIGRELYVEFGYGEKMNDTYRYGFKLIATNFLNITRTIQWDTVNGIVPRIWILGDKPLPSEWHAWLLWNYKWYEVVG